MSENLPGNEPSQNTPVPPVPGTTPDAPAVPVAPAVPESPAAAPAYPSAPEFPAAPASPVADAQQPAPGAPYAAAAPAAPAGAPYAGAAPVYPTGPAKPKGLAIAGMSIGIAGLVLSWVPFFGVLLALVGVVISIIAMVKKQPIGFTLTGLITGAIGLIIGAFVTIALMATLAMVAAGGGDLVELGTDMVAQCEAGAESVEVFGEKVLCSDIM